MKSGRLPSSQAGVVEKSRRGRRLAARSSLPQSSEITYTHDTVTGKLITVATPEGTYTFVHDDEGGADDTGQLVSVEMDPTAAGAATSTLTYT